MRACRDGGALAISPPRPPPPAVDSQAPSRGVPIHVTIFDIDGDTLEKLFFFDNDGNTVEVAFCEGDGDVVEVVTLNAVGGNTVDATVFDENGNAIEFTIIHGLDGSAVEVTIDDVGGKTLEVAVFDMYVRHRAPSRFWEFRPEAKSEEMSEEVHVSEVGIAERVCMFHYLAWAASFYKMIEIFLTIVLLTCVALPTKKS